MIKQNNLPLNKVMKRVLFVMILGKILSEIFKQTLKIIVYLKK
jgi:hypothetical protein